jgi:glutamate 5-kinase
MSDGADSGDADDAVATDTAVTTDTATAADADAADTAALDAEAITAARQQAAAADRVVVKAGTNSLTDDESNLSLSKLHKLVDDITDLRDRGKQVVLVSSGAVGAGIGRIGYESDTIEESQALSTIGQSQLMTAYSESFARYDTKVAQILLTQHDLDNPDRFTNIRNTIETLLEWGVVPIINENDAIATEELRIGDNDRLSSSVAIGIDVGGVYTGNPKTDANAELIDAVGANYDEVQAIVDESSTESFGGIQTKVEGARRVSEHGLPGIIAASTEPDVLARIADGETVGTIFLPINGVDNE